MKIRKGDKVVVLAGKDRGKDESLNQSYSVLGGGPLIGPGRAGRDPETLNSILAMLGGHGNP